MRVTSVSVLMVWFAPSSKPVTLTLSRERCQIKSELLHLWRSTSNRLVTTLIWVPFFLVLPIPAVLIWKEHSFSSKTHNRISNFLLAIVLILAIFGSALFSDVSPEVRWLIGGLAINCLLGALLIAKYVPDDRNP
jgi:hypothetical protein